MDRRGFRYEQMLPHKILRRRKALPAAFIGLGGLEWHGHHLAVGNDALKAERLCELAAERSGGFAFPTIWYGEPRTVSLLEADVDPDGAVKQAMGFRPEKFRSPFAGKTPEDQERFYEDLVYHVLVQMNQLEMRGVCLLCGHYPLHKMASKAVERFNAQYVDTKAYAGIEFHYWPGSEKVGGDHAAKWETSYLWHLRPECVQLERLSSVERPLLGIHGEDPRKTASREIGREACDLIVEGMIKKARELVSLTQ